MIKVLDHFWLKIVALILGLLLWFHVATEKTYNHELLLPVSEVVLGEELALVEPPPDSLRVTVSATGKQLLRRKWRERGVRISAAQYRTGQYRVELGTSNTSLDMPDGSITLEEVIFPTTITLSIDRREETNVNVVPDLTIEPDDGYAVGSISATSPSEVALSGPRSVISKLKEVQTQPKELRGIRNNLTLTLPLAKPDGYGVTVEPDSVSVTINIVPVKTRVFENVPIVIYNSPPSRVVSTQPSSVKIEVTGPPTDIDLLNKNALIASADFNEADSSGRTPIKIDCPTKFRVKHSSSDSVTIVVE